MENDEAFLPNKAVWSSDRVITSEILITYFQKAEITYSSLL